MRVAVALSGGGFRASLFHLGVLRRIAELGWLARVDAISGVSGGSIIAAFAAIHWREMLLAGGDADAFENCIAGPFVDLITTRSFVRDWFKRTALVGIARIGDATFSRTTAFGDVLSELLYGQQLCTDLPATPYIILNATSLISVRAWRFTRDGLGDSRIGYATWEGSPVLSIGHAVAASAAFPPLFSPAKIDARSYTFSGTKYSDARIEVPREIALTDGGVYENLGTEVLTKATPLPGGVVVGPPDFLIVSDGGYPTRHEFGLRRVPGLASLALLRRVNTIALEQVSALRRRKLVNMFEGGQPHGLLVGLGSTLGRIQAGGGDAYRSVVGSHTCPPAEVVERLQRIRTHLNRFSCEEARALMYYGYVLTDAFLWARADRLPPDYRHAGEMPKWRVEFTPDVIARTLNALSRSHRTW